MANIQDVARRAGVSTATVSRTLATPEKVKPATRKRVLGAVHALEYQPNAAAKVLRTTRTAKVVVTVPDISNPFFSSVIRGVEEAAQEWGYSVLLGDTRDDPEREEQYARMLGHKEADGLIFLGHRLPEAAARLVALKGARAPVVNGCEFSPDLHVSSVHINNRTAAHEATRHLYALGHERVGVITGPLHSPLSQDRLEGVREAAARAEMSASLVVRVGDFSIESGETEARALLSSRSPPTGLFCFSDEMAIGALKAIHTLGKSCPADVSVVGFDDIKFAKYAIPSLTTVSQPMPELGRQTFRLLMEILEGRNVGITSITLPHALTVRESTAPPSA
jgi:LacI family repressor for deo operon, udp, cdd, tsx, nupC, and nupG